MISCLAERTARSFRKDRLFAVACCNRALEVVPDPDLVDVFTAAERAADDFRWSPIVTRLAAKLGHFYARTNDDEWEDLYWLAGAAEALTDDDATDMIAERCRGAVCGYWDSGHRGESLFQADLLRDIFGDPFRPIDFLSTWRTETAVGIAAKMYDEREFGNMPVLADALEDAGCEVMELLSHCREPGQHVRGCWVVDLVLGKS